MLLRPLLQTFTKIFTSLIVPGAAEEEENEEGIVNIPFIPSSDSGSRLQNEFKILKFIGKGGFGDVIKVSVDVMMLSRLVYGFNEVARIDLTKQFEEKQMIEGPIY